MSYLLFSLPFLAAAAVAAAVLLVVAARRSPERPVLRRYAIAAPITLLGLVLLTAVFDNVMIAAGLFHYAPEHLLGISIGLAPIEDFGYPLAAAILLPAVWEALGGLGERS